MAAMLVGLTLLTIFWIAASRRGAGLLPSGAPAQGDYVPDREPAGEITGAHLPGDRCITLLGTSLTARGEHWFAKVEGILRDHGFRAELVRHGGVGRNSDWGVGQFPTIPGNTGVLMIEFCMNDASLNRGLTPGRAIANHEWLIRECRKQGITPALCTMSPARGHRRVSRPWLQSYHDQYRLLARRHRVALLDTVPDWQQALKDDGTGLIPDGVHPTDDAMVEVFSLRLADFLRMLPLEQMR